MNKIPMTSRGAEKLRKELEYLKNVCRPKITKSIADAREYGDLKENAEYHAAREQQGFCEYKIEKIKAKLFNAQVIDVTKITPNGIVIFGATVIIENINKKEKKKYCIVGDDEADFKQNLISINSPLARGIVGKKEGDIVVIKTPSGGVEYKIISVYYL